MKSGGLLIDMNLIHKQVFIGCQYVYEEDYFLISFHRHPGPVLAPVIAPSHISCSANHLLSSWSA